MIKYLATLVLLLPSFGFACTKCQCATLLDIVIQNNTNTDCHVTQLEAQQGYFYSKQAPQMTILRAETSRPYTITQEATGRELEMGVTAAADILFSIQCGEDKFATFSSQKNHIQGWFFGNEEVTSDILSLSNMDATFHIKESDCAKQVPSTVYWTLQ